MSAAIDFEGAHVYAIPMRSRFRGITVRTGMVLRGPAGWGEFCPFPEYDDAVAADWLATAIEQCTIGLPEPVRGTIPVNVTVPAVHAQRAHEIAAGSDCRTAKVKVADHPESLSEDIARLEAVRDALGPHAAIRVDANAAWDVETAVTAIPRMERAAAGLEYVEQPCPGIDELAAVRRRVEVPIAADESIRRADDPLRVAVAEAADIAVIKCTPLGGVRRALRVAESAGLPCVVSSALETSVGLSAQLALAGALPELRHACGLGTLALLEGDLVGADEAHHPVGGALPVSEQPPEPDPELLDYYADPDPERVRWWHARLDRTRRLLNG